MTETPRRIGSESAEAAYSRGDEGDGRLLPGQDELRRLSVDEGLDQLLQLFDLRAFDGRRPDGRRRVHGGPEALGDVCCAYSLPAARNSVEGRMVESNPAVMMGKPVIAGTRITVELILEKLAAGESVEQIVEAHPRLSREAVLEAIAFAARTLRGEVVYPLSGKAA